MKRAFLAILISLVMVSMTFAADINLQWNVSNDAESYKIYQSIDNGVTWVPYWDRSEFCAAGPNSDYDPCIVVDSQDTVHLAFARSVGTSLGLEYVNFSAANNYEPSAIYNITQINVGAGPTPECVAMAVNSSDAVHFFWYDSNATCGGVESLWNRTFYKNVWSPMRYQNNFGGANIQ